MAMSLEEKLEPLSEQLERLTSGTDETSMAVSLEEKREPLSSERLEQLTSVTDRHWEALHQQRSLPGGRKPSCFSGDIGYGVVLVMETSARSLEQQTCSETG